MIREGGSPPLKNYPNHPLRAGQLGRAPVFPWFLLRFSVMGIWLVFCNFYSTGAAAPLDPISPATRRAAVNGLATDPLTVFLHLPTSLQCSGAAESPRCLQILIVHTETTATFHAFHRCDLAQIVARSIWLRRTSCRYRARASLRRVLQSIAGHAAAPGVVATWHTGWRYAHQPQGG